MAWRSWSGCHCWPIPTSKIAPISRLNATNSATSLPTDSVPDFSGRLRASGRVAILVSRYNELITTRLLEGALSGCREAAVERDAVDVIWLPGAFELPAAAAVAAESRVYSCLIALGAVIRGDTPHFEYVAGEAARGL